MCGIAGELRLTLGERPSRERVRAMNDVMIHRGPDSFGEYQNAEVALGMRRLAINDVAGGQQPLGNEDGSVQVVCNGEIYNAPALTKELVARGHTLRTHSDVEVIAHLYEEKGLDVAQYLDGMFAFAIWDAKEHRLVLGRDRAGIKPLYLTRIGDRLVWGSEAKCLLAAGLAPRLDHQALHDYLTLGYVAGPASIFDGVWQLPAGCMLIAEPGKSDPLRTVPYWTLAGHVRGEQRSDADWEAELEATLKGAVESHLMSDVPLGVFLSGGLDSGSIVALMSELGVSPIRTFTIGFEEKSFSEADTAREVATRYGTEHHELIVRPDAVTLLPKLVRYFDEPFADSSAIPVYHVSELARQHVTVVLSGEGGDEMLAGYETYRAWKIASAYARLPRWIGGGLIPAAVRHLPVSHAKVSFDYKAKRFTTGAYLPPATAHLWWKTILDEDMKVALYGSRKPGVGPTSRLFEALWRESDGEGLERLQYVDTALYLPADILVKVDRMSMAHSLEARVPFLDRSMMELSRRLPSRLRMKGLNTKWILRRVMRDRLPASVLRGKKRGFNVPMPAWLAGNLRDFTRDVLGADRIRRQGLFDAAAVQRLIDEHTRKVRDHSRAIWTLLVLSVWQDEVVGTATTAAQRAAAASA
jgi:asparagine synthase (glutamine-hydrolysing)